MSRRQSTATVAAPSQAAGVTLPDQTLVLDAGAYTIKAGFAPSDPTTSPDIARDCHAVPNCIAKSRENHVYVGSQLSQCVDFGEMTFKRPVQNGYIVNWPTETSIWEHTFLEKNAVLYVSLPSLKLYATRNNTDKTPMC